MKYICEACNYESYDFGNFSRHKQSKKHFKNVNKHDYNITQVKCLCNMKKDNNIAEVKRLYFCKFCGKNFSHHQSMYRHMSYYCKNRNICGIKSLNKVIHDIVNEEHLDCIPNKIKSLEILDEDTNNTHIPKKKYVKKKIPIAVKKLFGINSLGKM